MFNARAFFCMVLIYLSEQLDTIMDDNDYNKAVHVQISMVVF